MTLALLLLFGGLCCFGLILGARWLEAQSWRRSLVAFKLSLPRGLKAEHVSAWLGTIRSSTHAARGALLPMPPVALELVAAARGIAYYLLVPSGMQGALLSGLRATLPGARLEEVPGYLADRPRCRVAAELRLSSHTRPLAHEQADVASAVLLAALQPLHDSEEIRIQWILTGAGTPEPVRTPPLQNRKNTDLPWWFENVDAADADAVRAARLKQQAPLLRAVARVGVTAPTKARAYVLFGRIWGPFRTLNAPGARLVRRWLPVGLVADRLRTLCVPVLVWPLLLNVLEAAGLVGLPIGERYLPGLSLGGARQLPPDGVPRTGAVLATSNYPGSHQPLALRVRDRLRHLHVVGPTGVGKSTLLGNLICQDIQAGASVVVVDARGDLVREVLARIPNNRRDDLILIDPAETGRPVGFNILRVDGSERGRELATDHVLHVFQDLFHASWGPRTADVLRASLLTLTTTRAQDGSTFTLTELPELLVNDSFRQFVTHQPTVTGALASFWRWYAGLSEKNRAQTIGPVLNKLRSFVLKAPLRLLLGQSRGVDLTEIFCKRRILLVPLSKGLLGVETAHLVGSLLVASVWQAALGRVAVPEERRRPVWLFADEFQEVVRLPLDLADMLAQARGLGLGLTLAHQHLGQLSEVMRTAVLGTARSQVVFQCDYEDARTLSRSFAPLTPDDLMGLTSFEVAIRPHVNGTTLRPVTGVTLPWRDVVADGAALAREAYERHGVPRAEVEAGLIARLRAGDNGAAFGRMRGELS